MSEQKEKQVNLSCMESWWFNQGQC